MILTESTGVLKMELLTSLRSRRDLQTGLEGKIDIFEIEAPVFTREADLKDVSYYIKKIGKSKKISTTIHLNNIKRDKWESSIKLYLDSGVRIMKLILPRNINKQEICELTKLIQKIKKKHKEPRVLIKVYVDDSNRYLPLDKSKKLCFVCGFDGLMIDTHIKKNKKSCLNYVSLQKLDSLIKRLGKSRKIIGVSGSLNKDDIRLLSRRGINIIGVTRILCDKNRKNLNLGKIKEVNSILRHRK